MKKIITLVFICLLVLTATAQNVTNVRFEQDGKMVKIYYDLSEEADVSIYLSTDAGKTYESSPLEHLSGHAGEGVAAGTNRCAVWDVLADREKLQGNNICFKIVAARRGTHTFNVGNVNFTMVYVVGGLFRMVSRDGDTGDTSYYPVKLSDYWIGESEVTQELWRAVMGNEPTYRNKKIWEDKKGRGEKYPVYYVSYEEVLAFINKLNKMTGCTFRLPTEAEWEYAARGGNKSQGYKYSGSDDLDEVAWYWRNSGDTIYSNEINFAWRMMESNNIRTHPVKSKKPNELGLYDMSGNVSEWCQDWHESHSYRWRKEHRGILQINPAGPSSGSHRVQRGGSVDGNYEGSWDKAYEIINRSYGIPECGLQTIRGFRLALAQ